MAARPSKLVALAGLVAGCLSPTLPLPPPEEPTSITAADGEPGVWVVRGGSTAGATVLIRNLRTQIITGADDRNGDGRYAIRLAAEQCDGAEVFEIVGDATSPATFFFVAPKGAGQPAVDCQ
jgi:hypothetical protein